MEFMRWGFFNAGLTAVAVIAGLPYGAFGVAVAYAACEYLRTPLLWLYVGRKGPVSTRDVMVATAPIIIGAHIVVVLLWALRTHLPGPASVQVLFAVALGYATCAATAALFPSGRATLREIRGFVLTALNRLR